MSTTRHPTYSSYDPDCGDVVEPVTDDPVELAVVTSFLRRDGDFFVFGTSDGLEIPYTVTAGTILLYLLNIDGEVVVEVDSSQIQGALS